MRLGNGPKKGNVILIKDRAIPNQELYDKNKYYFRRNFHECYKINTFHVVSLCFNIAFFLIDKGKNGKEKKKKSGNHISSRRLLHIPSTIIPKIRLIFHHRENQIAFSTGVFLTFYFSSLFQIMFESLARADGITNVGNGIPRRYPSRT